MPEQINIMDYFSQRASNSLQKSAEIAVNAGSNKIDTEHLLAGVLSEDEVVKRVIKELKLDIELLQKQLSEYIGEDEDREISYEQTPTLSPRVKQVLQQSFMESRNLGHNYIGGEHILLGLISEGEGLASQLFVKYGVDYNQARQAVVKVVGEGDEKGEKITEKSETPNLDKYSRDLTQLAYDGKIDPIIGRADEITRVIQILSRRKKNNPVLIGEPGVGKTAIAEGLAYRISKNNVPDILRDKRVKELDVALLVAGAKFRGEFEERAKKVIKELQSTGGQIILFIDELHTIVGSGASEGQMDLSNMLKPALARGELKVIGATTLNEYKKYIEKDSALERRFQPVLVNEPTVDQTIDILKGLRDKYEAHHKVKITDEAIVSASIMSDRYIKDRFLPDKAIDLIDESASKVRIESSLVPDEIATLQDEIEKLEKEREAYSRAGEHEKGAQLKVQIEKLKSQLQPLNDQWSKKKGTGTPTVTADSIADLISLQTGIPVSQLKSEDKERLLHLEEELHKKVVGQDEAVKAVSEAVRRARVGLKDPNRPIGSFLFMGPTGVGKTLLAKTLAWQIFGDEEAMIRLDMSEYMEKFAVSRMVGSPPGYVGYEEGGQLTEAVRRQPYSVILLDEIEKAHSDVFNILLQILDDGRLTDAKGRTVDFKNTILIATSNIGSDLIMDSLKGGKDPDWDRLKEKMIDRLKSHFRPEFLNRLDDVVIFRKLEKAQIREVAKILIDEVVRMLKAQGFELIVTDTVLDHLADIGYDPEFGARPMRRVIQESIENKLADGLLKGDFKPGQKITVDFKEGKVLLNSKF